MTMPGGAPEEFPVNSFPVGPGDFNDLSTRTEENVVEALKAQIQTLPGWSGASNSFFGQIGNILMRVLSGVGDLTGILGGIGQTIQDLMNLRWLQVDDHEDRLVDLQDKTQQLEGVIGHGTRYMSSSPGVTTSQTVMPFDTTVGPMVGVTPLSGGRFRLNSKGLWDFHAQCEFTGGFLCPPEVYMDIVIRDPNGNEVGRRKAKGSSQEAVTVYNYYSYTIPSAGYTAEVRAWTSSLLFGFQWRGIAGGLGTTGFSARKISSETS